MEFLGREARGKQHDFQLFTTSKISFVWLMWIFVVTKNLPKIIPGI